MEVEVDDEVELGNRWDNDRGTRVVVVLLFCVVVDVRVVEVSRLRCVVRKVNSGRSRRWSKRLLSWVGG